MSERTTCTVCGRTYVQSACPGGPHDWTDRYEFADDEQPADRDTNYYERESYDSCHGQTFTEARRRALHNSGWLCEDCGLTDLEHRQRDDLFGGGLHVHHTIDAIRFEDSEQSHIQINLEVLCATCHRQRSTWE